jgi:hypothetical protein
MTYQFLKQQPKSIIPIPDKVIRFTDDTDPINFTLMSRIDGYPLSFVITDLSYAQISKLQDQMLEILKEMRSYTSKYIQKVDGSPADDFISSVCCPKGPPKCFKMGRTTEEWLEMLPMNEMRIKMKKEYPEDMYSEETRAELLAQLDASIQEAKDTFPHGGPYVLTHGDLSLQNILVKDDRIVGLVDWEMSGYYPQWVDRFMCEFYGHRTGTDQFFAPIWPKLGMSDSATYQREVHQPIKTLQTVFYGISGGQRDHPEKIVYFRKKFCDCKPYAGCIKEHYLGPLTGAHVCVTDPSRRSEEGSTEKLSAVEEEEDV